MKTFFLSISAFILFACASSKNNTTSNEVKSNNASSVVKSNDTKSPSTNTNSPATPSSNYTVYTKHPQASNLLSEEQLKTKKLYTKLSEALKEPQNVFRLKVGDYEQGFDGLKLTEKIGELYNLQELEIDGIFESLPKEIGKLTQLQKVKINIQNLKNELPNEIANWKNIQELSIFHDYASESIKSNCKLSNLNVLNSVKFLKLEGKLINVIPCSLSTLNVENFTILSTTIKEFPTCISTNNKIKNLTIEGANELTSISKLPTSLKEFRLVFAKKLNDISIAFQKNNNLSKIEIGNCENLTSIKNLELNEKIKEIFISSCNNLKQISNLNELKYLEELTLYNLNSYSGEIISIENKLYRLKTIALINIPNDLYISKLNYSFIFDLIAINNVPNFKSKSNFILLEKNIGDYISLLLQNKFKGSTLYVSNINDEELRNKNVFNISQDLYFEHKESVSASQALKVTKKEKVKDLSIDLQNEQKAICEQALQVAQTFQNLKNVSISIGSKNNSIELAETVRFNNVNQLMLTSYVKDDPADDCNYSWLINVFNKFPNIEHLKIWTNSAKVVNLNFNPLSKLKTLNIYGKPFENLINSKNLSSNLSFLKNTSIESIEIDELVNAFPEDIYNLPKLKDCKIYVYAPSDNYQLDIKDKIENLKNLKILDININIGFKYKSTNKNNVLSAKIDPKINTLINLEKLTIVVTNFQNYQSGQKSFTYPDGIENLKNLKELDLSHVTSNPKGIEKLNLIKKTIQLK